MAKPQLRAESVPVTLPPILSYLLGVPAAPREAVERTIQMAIDALDEMDGDPDAEANGTEDDFVLAWWQHASGPGCTVSDPDSCVDDVGEEGGDLEGDWAGHAHLLEPIPAE